MLFFRLEKFAFSDKRVFFFYKNFPNGPAHLHPALIIIKQTLGHVESILLAMGRVKFFLFFNFILLENIIENKLQSISNWPLSYSNVNIVIKHTILRTHTIEQSVSGSPFIPFNSAETLL